MRAKTSSLSLYNEKRDFSRTPEPKGRTAPVRQHGLTFVVQKHAARRLHYDLRLEWKGVLWSWAVTRGPSNDPNEKRLAVRTEDHPLSYRDFEGTIRKGEYGGGTMMIWDQGSWEPLHDPDEGMRAGKLHFRIAGTRMKGGWTLVRMRNRSDKDRGRENWLLIKERDDEATDTPDVLSSQFTSSITSGRTMEAIASDDPLHAPAPAPPAAPDSRRLLANPTFHKPQLATLVDAAPEGDDWLHETKFDGYRCQISLGSSGSILYSRAGHDWTDKFQDLLPSVATLRCRNALIDGEVVARHHTTSAFSALQQALKSGGALQFHAFDLLVFDGVDLRATPLVKRKHTLEKWLKESPPECAVRYSTHIVGQGADVVQHICKSGGEGIISKRVGSPYLGTRSGDWLKIKCTQRREFVVGGFSPSAKRGRLFASLLVGDYENGVLHYRGRVGSGFCDEDMSILSRVFAPLERETSPFQKVPGAIAASARWLSPAVVVEVSFSELTGDGHVRHGVYAGHREDKPAREVAPEPTKSVSRVKVGNVTISNPDRELFAQPAISKADLARHYELVAPRLLEIAGNRPLSLVRCPQGPGAECFFQKHAGKGFPDELQEIAITESSGAPDQYLYVNSAQGFIAAVQMGTIEFHIWGSRIDRLEKPDRLVFDLDPDEGLAFEEVKAAAFLVRRQLKMLGLTSTPLLTGGKGIHVCTPLRRTVTWETLKIYAKTLASILAHNEPKRFTANMSKARRKGRIFIDWLRNERGATAITPYSVRARPGAPVATPVTWAELKKLQSASAFSIADMRKRLAKPCPYLAALENPQSLGKDAVAALDKLFRQ